MSFWPPIKSALEHVFVSATGIPFVWQEEARRVLRPPLGVLELGQSMSIGRDTHSYKFRHSDISLDICGHRELTIGVQIVSRLAKNLPTSRELAEKARLALSNPVYRDELRSAGLVLIECHPIVNLSINPLQRKTLRSSFDIVFSLTLNEEYNWPNMGYFESVDISESIL